MEYPRTLMEFERRFPSEEACQAYLAEARWPDGFSCPRCLSAKTWKSKRGLLICAACGRQVSVTSGTIFQDSHLPLRTWFRAMWWVTNQKHGVSALGLQRLLGLGSYRTAWACLQKLRRAMVRPGREKLDGAVEVDAAFVGGVEPGGGRRHLGDKALVVIAAQVEGKGIGRIRMKRIPNATGPILLAFVKSTVEPGAVVLTDGFQSYPALAQLGYQHQPRPARGSGKTASTLLPRVHRVTSLLKRWLLGTHQGAVSRDQLEAYLEEFTFRFNRRTSRHRGKLFHRLIEQAVQVEPAPYATLIRRSTPKG